MKMSAPVLRLTAWITLASLVAMLWSALAHAQPKTGMDFRFAGDICSTADAVAPTWPPASGEDGHDAHVRHCAFCAKHDVAHVLPSRDDPALILWPRAVPVVAAAADLPLAWTPWRNPHLRGPPLPL